MLVNGKHHITIWTEKKYPSIIYTIDQNLLPHKFEIIELKSSSDIISAIKNMTVRGAPLIGVTAAYGIFLAAKEAYAKNLNINRFDNYIYRKSEQIKSTRPTAVNLFNAVENSLNQIYRERTKVKKVEAAFVYAKYLSDYEINSCRAIGKFGLNILKNILKRKKDKTINILTHCNAGWLGCIDYGTATAPIYFAHKEKINLHVWIEETRPRNQGAGLTAWELMHNNIDCTVITDNAGGYVMQKGMVDIVIVGSDRTTFNGEVCNKIGTYKTALAAKDNNIPFYAALPVTSFDFKIKDAMKEIPIEERNGKEVSHIRGLYKEKIINARITPQKCKVRNFSFDITPSKLVTALITDKGIIKPDVRIIKKLI
ncbi:MAG: S-methyl-5-thioribose-1-phosphate isomerase [Ignavibacteria bacterium]|nr:S-methyl-5-thioribose-1-phosphate isomerase [Ignavibacteria bacterium]